ncbi:hypothetical protein N7478_008558 [Penicillium angulare]|uniref:uncharacterized protein n=1 Tax=Penicillium angulare TaxID=116970 RepID=UPI0025423AA5|nr:uncharacterized protein N7478_008558 [Penicillium angulare]KAJ5273433.1 hypothetical protein N7478_008558 [Penicillium angulare]
MQCVPGRTEDPTEQLPEVEILGWTDECSSIFDDHDALRLRNVHAFDPAFTRTAPPSGVALWDMPNLRIQGRNRIGASGDRVAYEPLIWANNSSEARALRKLSALVVEGRNFICSNTLRSCASCEIHGARAEYASESIIAKRQVGSKSDWDADKSVSLDIDGASGEIVTEPNR